MDDKKFTKTFWYVCSLTGCMLTLIAAMIFLHIPKENEQNATLAFGTLLGLLGSTAAVLIGANPMTAAKKPDQTTGTTTADISATVTTTAEPAKTDNP